MAKLHEMLGTKNRTEQEERVEKLITTPPVAIMVYYDGYSDKVTVVPAPARIPIQYAKHVLQRGLEEVIQREVQALAEQSAEQADQQSMEENLNNVEE